jgi:predicted Fe-S protein YdhL (DUF1289 family)
VRVCIVDGESGLCIGCLRTLPEIASWGSLTPERRAEIMAELPSRRSPSGAVHGIKTVLP